MDKLGCKEEYPHPSKNPKASLWSLESQKEDTVSPLPHCFLVYIFPGTLDLSDFNS